MPFPFENSATISTTEYSLPNNSTTLTPVTEDGTMQAWIDISALQSGDQYEWKLYEKVIGSGTQRIVASGLFMGPTEPVFVFPAFMVRHGWDFTLKKLAGTDRSISWSLRSP